MPREDVRRYRERSADFRDGRFDFGDTGIYDYRRNKAPPKHAAANDDAVELRFERAAEATPLPRFFALMPPIEGATPGALREPKILTPGHALIADKKHWRHLR